MAKFSKGTPHQNVIQKCWKKVSPPATVGSAPQVKGKPSPGFDHLSKSQTPHKSGNPFKKSGK